MSGSLTEGWDSVCKGWEGLTHTLYSAAKNLKRSHRAEVIKDLELEMALPGIYR